MKTQVVTFSFMIALRNVRMWETPYGVGANYDVYIDGIKAFNVNDNANGAMYQYSVFVPELYNRFKTAVEALPKLNVFGAMMKVDTDMALALIHDQMADRMITVNPLYN